MDSARIHMDSALIHMDSALIHMDSARHKYIWNDPEWLLNDSYTLWKAFGTPKDTLGKLLGPFFGCYWEFFGRALSTWIVPAINTSEMTQND